MDLVTNNQTNQQERTLDTIGLDKTLGLNDLDNDSSNADHTQEPAQATQAQPVEAKEFILLELPSGFKIQLGSCYHSAIQLSEQAVAIYNSLTESKDKREVNYLG